ncbi:hypothetical protein BHE74_00058404, partial [Ensete ventricosum]
MFITKVCNFDLYRSVQAVHTGPSGYRYVDRPLSGGSVKNRPSIEEEKGKKRKRKKKRRGEERIPHQRRPRPPAVAAHGSPARRFVSHARRRSISPREETDRGD